MAARQSSRIEINPGVMRGKPVIRGTRITVQAILDRLAAGETVNGLLKSHPKLKREDIRAALKYAGGLAGRPYSLRTARNAGEPAAPAPSFKTELGARLWKLRQKAVAGGMKLMNLDEINEEVKARHGSIEGQ